jgi:peptide-methionine (S)-S-oxide reductase
MPVATVLVIEPSKENDMLFGRKSGEMPAAEDALPGRSAAMEVPETHYVNGNGITPPYPDGLEMAYFAMGCFWGAERIFWNMDGVYTTAVGYQGGSTPNPTYGEVCSGRTGHAEAVMVVFDPMKVRYEELLGAFWENHDPTTPNRQGNDVGTQYRSAIYWTSEQQRKEAEASRDSYQDSLSAGGHEAITTEIAEAGPFYYAEEYHQQYLAKNPHGYCNHGFCQVSYESAKA